MKALFLTIVILTLSSCSCHSTNTNDVTSTSTDTTTTLSPESDVHIPDTTANNAEKEKTPAKGYSDTERRMIDMGLVDIAVTDPSIPYKIIYATADNFVGEVLYEDINHALMLPECAAKLSDAQRRLKALHPDYSLLVYDAARPMSVQRKMWNVVVPLGKTDYVSNPSKGGGLHNYGAAVDVTIIDSLGVPLDMGSAYDYFGAAARTDNEAKLLDDGIITSAQLENRLLLRRVMKEAGFRTITSEWWHFNLVTRPVARQTLKLID